MSIYDRSRWPSPQSNPLVIMLLRGDAWYSNSEINAAISPGVKGLARCFLADWPTLADELGPDQSLIESRSFGKLTNERQGQVGGVERFYSRKALIHIAMRARTPVAAAFRDWLAGQVSTVITGELVL